MTAHRDLKRIIRERQKKTGESYTASRAHVMRDRAALLGLEADAPAMSEPLRVDAAVLKVNRQSARVRIVAETGQVTFRSPDVWRVVPGHLVTLVIERRWTWRDDAYASGRIENPRIDVAKLGLEPLPLEDGELDDVRSHSELFRPPDPYASLWENLTAKPRPSFVFDGITWEAFPGLDPEETPTCDAAELIEEGDHEGAWELLMETLGEDLRCIDAHAHLASLVFEYSPERAMLHYEVGIRIGELSLPPRFDGLIIWGRIFNRPFLRCLHGHGLCLWRLGRFAEAERVFERILSLNPNDNQGVRFCLDDVRNGKAWEELRAQEEAKRVERRRDLN
jgi:hypothetical protein